MNLSEEPNQLPRPMASPLADAKRLQRSSRATADELREFLSQMRGNSPKEMLGAVASSNLGKSLVQATVGTLVLIVVLTVVPFVWNKLTSSEGEEVQAEVVEEEVASEEVAEVVPEESDSSAPAPAPTPVAADALGIGEAVDSAPDVNPLEGANDDLLEGLE
jgi:hypothetical protein